MISKVKQKGYKIKSKIVKKKREKKIKKKEINYNLEDLIKDFRQIGLKKGDIALVHSSLKSLGFVNGGANAVVKALMEVLGPNGTLAMPTNPMRGGVLLNCQRGGFIFDLKKDRAYTGAIPNFLLTVKGIHRSIHPTHSISAIGRYAKEITEKHHIGNRTYGENSPWAKIIELNGKILGLGITLAWTTQYHHLEDIMGDDFPVKVKVDETYKLKCRIEKKKIIEVEVQPNDPNVYRTRIEKNPFLLEYFTEIYNKLNVLHNGKIGNASSWWVFAREFMDILRKLAEIGITIYSTEDFLKKNKLYPFELIKNRLE